MLLHAITPSRISGAERSTTSLCEHLGATGRRVVVAVKSGSPLVGVMRDAGIDARDVMLSGKLNLSASGLLALLARKEGARVIHSHLSSAAWHATLAGRRAGLPVVAHVRALNSPFWYRWAPRVIAVSRAVKEHLYRGGIPADRIDVVYNGVDPARYYLPCSREQAKIELGLPLDEVLVGVVAHLTAKKGHETFLAALSLAVRRSPRLTAVLIGEGEERGKLEDIAQSLGLEDRVRFAGFQSDVLPYYAAMDMLVLPSISGEGLPRALLESGLLGRPAIATRLSGAPEIVQEGSTGYLVPVRDPVALADRMVELAVDPGLREQFGKAAREYVAATFTVEAMVEGVLSSYRRAGADV